MNYCWKFGLVLAALMGWLAVPVFGESITVITPYYGTEENHYQNRDYGLSLKDSQRMKGFFIQSVEPETYQWNIFLYQTQDINYSDLHGVNFIYDRYLGKPEEKVVLGFGMNYLEMDLAGKNVPLAAGRLEGLYLDMSIFSPYLRIGKYYHFGEDKLRTTMLPWIGAQVDYIEGSGRVDFPGPGAIDFTMDDDPFSWIAGVNLKLYVHRFLQIEGKYAAAYHESVFRDKHSAIVNLFFSRRLGVSYRYHHQETDTGIDSYQIFGIAMVF